MKNIALIITLLAFSACNEASNYVEIKTNYGNITIELFDETPLHRDNFQKLVKEGFYDDLLFHRIIQNFMIQGGDPDSKDAKQNQLLGSGGPGYTIPAEIGASERCFHHKGVLSAARQGDNMNPERASSGSQFYIVVGRTYNDREIAQMEQQHIKKAKKKLYNEQYKDSFQILKKENKRKELKQIKKEFTQKVDAEINAHIDDYYMTLEQKIAYKEQGGTPHLDGAYTVFGEVIEGLDVVETIAKVTTNSSDRPLKDVKMKMKFIKKR